MSAIHQALKKAEGGHWSAASSQFNPLQAKVKTQKNAWAYGLPPLLLITAAVVFFYPQKTEKTQLTSAKTIIETQTEVIANRAADLPSQNLKPVLAVQTTQEEPEDSQTKSEAQTITASTEPGRNTSPTIKPVDASSKVTKTAQNKQPIISQAQTLPSTKPIITRSANTVKVQESAQSEVKTEKSLNTPPTSVATEEPSLDAKNISPVAINNNTEPNSNIIRTSVSQWQDEVEQLIAAGEVEQAESKLKNWIASEPKSPAPRILLAKIYLNNGLFQAAEPLLSGIEQNQAKALLGLVYERTQRAQLAAEIFETLYRSQPEQHQWLLFWAINSENSGQLAKSAALYQNYLNNFAAVDASLTRFAQQRFQAVQGQQ